MIIQVYLYLPLSILGFLSFLSVGFFHLTLLLPCLFLMCPSTLFSVTMQMEHIGHRSIVKHWPSGFKESEGCHIFASDVE